MPRYRPLPPARHRAASPADEGRRGFPGVSTQIESMAFTKELSFGAQSTTPSVDAALVALAESVDVPNDSAGCQPCDTDGRALPGTSVDYANCQLAQEGVSL